MLAEQGYTKQHCGKFSTAQKTLPTFTQIIYWASGQCKAFFKSLTHLALQKAFNIISN